MIEGKSEWMNNRWKINRWGKEMNASLKENNRYKKKEPLNEGIKS